MIRSGRAAVRQTAQVPATYKPYTIPAPTLGIIANANPAQPPSGGALILENFIPRATDALLRRGSQLYHVISDGVEDVVSLFTYKNGSNEKLFAATASGIYDVSTATTQVYFTDGLGNRFVASGSGDDAVAFIPSIMRAAVVVSDLTSGDWSAVQFATSGGVFLDMVNGADTKLLYDGTNFYPIAGTSLYAFNYTAETAPFTVGKTLTGGTSSATGTIVKVIDNGTTGTLWINNVSGTFQTAETITDDNGTPGSATSDGTPTLLFGAMTGVDLTKLSYNWTHQQRLFYIQKDTLSAWYLPATSISGAAVELPLGGVFNLGGSLLFGSSWSLETGAGGLQEYCAFFTTEGEAAVYQGADPSTADTWAKVGVYRIGKPLGPQAHFRAGGDIVVSTDIGLIPLSTALQKDFSVLSPSAVSAPIETIWNNEVSARFGANWRCQIWSANQIAIVNPPTVNNLPAVLYVANLRTGAWGKFTGWNSKCMAVFQNRLFFGSTASQVIEANVTGSDMGQPYTGIYVPLFSDFGAPTTKTAGMTRAVMQSFAPLNEQLSMQVEFDVNLPSVPVGSVAPTSNVWGGGVWGSAIWGQGLTKATYSNWHSTPNTGNAMAPALQLTSGSIVPLDATILRMDVTYTTGDLVT
jgi:hypothetical protein